MMSQLTNAYHASPDFRRCFWNDWNVTFSGSGTITSPVKPGACGNQKEHVLYISLSCSRVQQERLLDCQVYVQVWDTVCFVAQRMNQYILLWVDHPEQEREQP